VTGSAMKNQENISVSEGVKNDENIRNQSTKIYSFNCLEFYSKQCMDEVFLMKIYDYSIHAYQSQLACIAETHTDRYLEKFISQIHEYVQQSEMILTCQVSMKQ